MSVVFIDTETTGLDSDRHDVWDIAAITYDGREWNWHPAPDLRTADSTALRLNRFYDRTNADDWEWDEPEHVAHWLSRIVADNHVVAAVPDFDARFLDRWLRRNGQAPAWHYHLIDIETMAAGWLYGWRRRAAATATEDASVLPVALPWRSDDLSRACGVEPPTDDERHTAIGDARWVRRWWLQLTRSGHYVEVRR